LKAKKESTQFEQKGIWKLGEQYVIRTVTMIQIGNLVYIDENELGLENASWIADTGRWMNFLKEGKYNECEPFPEGIVIVGRHSIIDVCVWKHKLPTEQK